MAAASTGAKPEQLFFLNGHQSFGPVWDCLSSWVRHARCHHLAGLSSTAHGHTLSSTYSLPMDHRPRAWNTELSSHGIPGQKYCCQTTDCTPQRCRATNIKMTQDIELASLPTKVDGMWKLKPASLRGFLNQVAHKQQQLTNIVRREGKASLVCSQ